MINGTTKISLRAARVNAGMTHDDAAEALSEYFGFKVSRQRVMQYEKHPSSTPAGFGQGFATVYHIPLEGINFLP